MEEAPLKRRKKEIPILAREIGISFAEIPISLREIHKSGREIGISSGEIPISLPDLCISSEETAKPPLLGQGEHSRLEDPACPTKGLLLYKDRL